MQSSQGAISYFAFLQGLCNFFWHKHIDRQLSTSKKLYKLVNMFVTLHWFLKRPCDTALFASQSVVGDEIKNQELFRRLRGY